MRSQPFTVILLVLAALPASAQEAVEVTFVVNDALVKDKLLAGVELRIAAAPGEDPMITGSTGGDGRFTTSLAPGTYAVSYLCPGYVPIPDSETVISSDGQIITTTLSLMLEAEGTPAARRIRIILNWGSDPSDVRDADSHLLCPCAGPSAHVYYADRVHQADTHSVDLDVDDVDWGGPETISIHEPPPGAYPYWVHDYSGTSAVLGSSEVVVRVLFDDVVAGEFRVPADLQQRNWRPFKAIVVDPDLRPHIEPFSSEELSYRAERQAPPDVPDESTIPDSLICFASFMTLFVLAVIAVLIVKRARG